MVWVRMTELTVRSIQFKLCLGFLGMTLAAAGCGTVRPDAPVSPSAESPSPTSQPSETDKATGEAEGGMPPGSYSQDAEAEAENAVPAVHGTVIRSPSGRIIAD